MRKILLFITIFNFVFLQEMMIYGHVYSSVLVENENNPISNAQVYIGMNSVPEGTLTFTNEEGYYELIFDWNWDGPIPIACEAINYDFFIETIMPSNTQIEFDISLNPIISGDINDDSLINIQDVILLINMILSNQTDSMADLNSDGMINVLDAIQLVNIILNNQYRFNYHNNIKYIDKWTQ